MRLEDLLNPDDEERDQSEGSAQPKSTAPLTRPPYQEERRPAASALSVLIFILFVLWSARTQLLSAVGNWLVVSEQPGRAGVIVVLSGSSYDRAQCGADLYKEGVAPRMLTIGSQVPNLVKSLGFDLTESQLTARQLQEHGVPAEAIEVVTSTGTSTWDEAVYTRHYVERHGLQRVVLVTSRFHTRRARLTFQHALRGMGVSLRVVASPYDPLKAERWWTREKELVAVNNEYLKLLHYTFKYFLQRPPA